MAGTKADFKIYNEFIHTGMVETLTQVSDVFNAASRGTIVLSAVSRKGELVYESFFTDTANLISRRDPTSTADATAKKLTQGEMVTVKVNRKIGPVENTLDSFKKIQKGPFDQNALDFAIGTQSAKGMQVEMLNTGLMTVRAALEGQAASKVDFAPAAAAGAPIETTSLVDVLAAFGDAAGSIAIWVMHSKPFYELVKSQIVDNIHGVSGYNISSATPITLNRPVLVTDSPALITSETVNGVAGTTVYHTLGLTTGAVELEDSEDTTVFSEYVTGKENLIIRIQGEYAYNIGIKGFTYDQQNGGVNPDNTALGSASNWDPALSDVKNRAGVALRTV